MESGPLRSAIATAVYGDLFHYPFTLQELWQFLWRPQKPTSFFFFLKIFFEDQSDALFFRNGHFCLPERVDRVTERQRRLRLVEKKMAIARRGARILRCVPWMRAVFVCNTVAFGTPAKESDIDLLIVVRHGRLWAARLLATLLLHLASLRRHGTHVTDRLCLSFYLADEALDLSRVALPQGDDIYLAFWVATLIPIFDISDIDRRLRFESHFVHEVLPNSPSHFLPSPRWKVEDVFLSNLCRRFFETCGSGIVGKAIESLARGIQRPRIEKKRSADRLGVLVSDSILKFHETDRREEYRDRWKKKVGEGS